MTARLTRRVQPGTPWRVYLGLSMLGELGQRIPIAWQSGTVRHTLNDHDEVKIVTSLGALDGIAKEFRTVRAGCLIVTYTDAFGIERIVSATPISKPVKQDRDARTITIEGKGPTWLLEDRVVTDRDYQPDDYAGLRKSTVAVTGRSFAAIISLIIRLTARERRQGFLPLVLPNELEKGDHERTYEGYNVANNGAWKRIEEITQVIGGPDIQFRPRWRDDERTRFEWEVLVGTDAQQTLPQARELNWDATVPGSDVATMEVTSSAETIAHRVYATGAGEGAAIALSMAEMPALPEYMPLVETAISDSDAEIDDANTGTSKLLTQKAQAALLNNALDQITMTVNADPRDQPIGTWWCGEQARVTTKGWLDVPDGEHKLRIIQTEYTLGSDLVTVDCQEDYLGEDLTW
ncbi:siphovirus ReqiPepy6 Gp37-like family protein [Brachybacterium halotolerans subsp. kimchii]|uniref:siphovirus ReqiPepy6 Gp37-like family protein n=1 Tax=Brachybacterium halotolerans TaxID=2795215 RepID=UPI001E2ECF69|nr:siphovirus ReqiPepy6 Gp37-like family protein [Brachybacterium halotolerans]UEJ82636.1 siphovirus ReqiPepy6 Gp37-like family protein [Brachybacterium halotolerans subsp. kimchii]